MNLLQLDQKGFNKVEILVVVLLMLFFLLGGYHIYGGLQSQARDAKRKADIQAISLGLEDHFNHQEKQYCNSSINTYCPVQNSWFGDNIPLDPLRGDYINLPKSGDKTYLICAHLENGNGNALDSNGTKGNGPNAQFFCQGNQQ